MLPRRFSLLALSMALLAAPADAAPLAVQAEIQREVGLLRTRFSTSLGTLWVHLPDDPAPGDRIAGSVAVEATGEQPRKLARNLERLGELRARLGGVLLPAGVGTFTGGVACGAEAPAQGLVFRCGSTETGLPPGLDLHLEDRRGRVLARARIPVAPAPPAPAEYRYPAVSQIGRAIEIEGAFPDGPAAARITIGGGPADLLAGSPRRLLVASPTSVVGPTTLSVTTAAGRFDGELRNLAVLMAADKMSLQANERTILRLQVNGLTDLPRPLSVELIAQAPDFVRLENGVRQEILIHPTEVQPGGVYQWIGTLVGVRPGGFGVVARVVPEGARRRLAPRR